jgi:hypothetical protein
MYVYFDRFEREKEESTEARKICDRPEKGE